jgi:tetratricopeptide (TPR) repeat protein
MPIRQMPAWESAVQAYHAADYRLCAEHCSALIAGAPQNPDYHLLLGVSLAEGGNPAGALAPMSRAVELAPGNANAWSARGNVLLALGHEQAALASYQRALDLDPGNAMAWMNIAVLHHRGGRFSDAVAACDRALQAQPDDPVTLTNRALSLQALGHYPDALADLDAAARLVPADAEALVHRGNIHQAMQNFDPALADYDRALQMDQANASARIGRGNILARRGDLAGGEQELRRAVALDPALHDAWFYLGNIQRDRKQFAAARDSYRKAILLDGTAMRAKRNLGLVTLLQGDFEHGLPLYEIRKALPIPVDARAFAAPAWSGGEEIAGKTVFVYTDQGLGDTIQFARFLTALLARDAKVVFAAQDRLHHLLAPAFPPVTFIAQDAVPEAFDFHLALASLPYLLGLRLGTIPAAVPYLRADRARVDSWRARIGPAGLRVAIAWQGAPGIDDERFFPAQLYKSLAELPGIRLIGIQTGPGASQREGLPIAHFDGLDDGPDAFRDTAAILECVDLIVTPDTSLAHLAGALDRPAFVLLKEVPDWRWLMNRSDTPWYPSLRLVRQPAFGDWAGAFALLKHQIAQWRDHGA